MSEPDLNTASRSEGVLDSLPPEGLIVLGAIFVQFGAGVAGSLVREYGPWPIVTLRIVFGAIMLLAVRPLRLRGASREALVSCIALGVILMAMNSSCYVALSRLPLGVAVAIEFWGPMTVAVLGSRRRLDLVWVALAAAGLYTLTGGRLNADDAVGIVAIFIAGGCWALYILVGGRVARYWPDGRGLSLSMLVASLLVLPVSVSIGGGVIVALFSSSLPYTLEIAAMRRLAASTFGVLLSLEPAIAAIAGFLILGQVLHPLDLAAIACVALASAGASLSARRLTVVQGELESV